MTLSDSDCRTCMPSLDDLCAGLSMATDVFARASAYLPHSPRHGQAHGYRVFWLEAGALRFRDVVEHPAGYAILGRHAEAHVRLLGDPTIALRHFVLRARRTPAGVPELHVADLLAPLPLFVDGSDAPQRSCAVEGAFSARLGAHALCALPFDGCASLSAAGGPGRGDRPDEDEPSGRDADDIDLSGLPPGFEHLFRPTPPPRAPRDPGPRAPQRVALEAVVRALPAPPAPSARRAQRLDVTLTSHIASTHVSALPETSPERAVLWLDLVGQGGRRTLRLSEAQLEGLVILGRYDRCLAGGDVFSTSVSRMHLGVTRSPEGIEVIDLASTQGVLVDGEPVHRAVISDGAVIVLSESGGELVRVRTAR
jgi:hypothetical protein